MKSCLLLIGVLLLSFFSNAQQCEYCNKTPKVVGYDMEVLVPKPTSADSLAKWYQLFFVSKYANAKLFELNKNCVRFTQPLVRNSEGNNVLMVGVTQPALPKNSTPSSHGDYLVTGTIYQFDKGYKMQLKLLTACDGVVVDEVALPFNLTTEGDHVKQVAENAAVQLSSLGEKINQFAKEQRDKNKDVAYANWSSASITVVPKKKKPRRRTGDRSSAYNERLRWNAPCRTHH